MTAALAETRARWDGIRRSTAPADREAAVDGVVLAYAAAGLPPPEHIVWCNSPIEIARCRREGQQGWTAGANVKSSIVDIVTRNVARAVEQTTSRTLRTRVWREARLTLPSPLSRSVMEAINTSVRAVERERVSAFWRGLGRMFLRRQRDGRDVPLAEGAFTNHDGAPLAIYEHLYHFGGLSRETAPLKGLWQVAASAGWMVPHQNVCWLSERPDALKVDADGRLHSGHGPALSFRDGWRYYAWKGLPVPSWMIDNKELITTGRVNRERDPVLRRCMIDIMTPERYIATSDAIRISSDETGTLWLKSWNHWDSWSAVEVVNGTPEPDGSYKHYFLQGPPTMRTAREAVAWTYGLSEHEYTRLRLRT